MDSTDPQNKYQTCGKYSKIYLKKSVNEGNDKNSKSSGGYPLFHNDDHATNFYFYPSSKDEKNTQMRQKDSDICKNSKIEDVNATIFKNDNAEIKERLERLTNEWISLKKEVDGFIINDKIQEGSSISEFQKNHSNTTKNQKISSGKRKKNCKKSSIEHEQTDSCLKTKTSKRTLGYTASTISFLNKVKDPVKKTDNNKQRFTEENYLRVFTSYSQHNLERKISNFSNLTKKESCNLILKKETTQKSSVKSVSKSQSMCVLSTSMKPTRKLSFTSTELKPKNQLPNSKKISKSQQCSCEHTTRSTQTFNRLEPVKNCSSTSLIHKTISSEHCFRTSNVNRSTENNHNAVTKNNRSAKNKNQIPKVENSKIIDLKMTRSSSDVRFNSDHIKMKNKAKRKNSEETVQDYFSSVRQATKQQHRSNETESTKNMNKNCNSKLHQNRCKKLEKSKAGQKRKNPCDDNCWNHKNEMLIQLSENQYQSNNDYLRYNSTEDIRKQIKRIQKNMILPENDYDDEMSSFFLLRSNYRCNNYFRRMSRLHKPSLSTIYESLEALSTKSE